MIFLRAMLALLTIEAGLAMIAYAVLLGLRTSGCR